MNKESDYFDEDILFIPGKDYREKDVSTFETILITVIFIGIILLIAYNLSL